MSSTREHNNACSEILIAIGAMPGVYAERYEPYRGRLLLPNGATPYVERGVEGVPDIIGWVSSPGCPALWFGHEVKTGKAVRSKVQRKFHARAEADGAQIAVVHSVEESVAHVERMLALCRRIAGLLGGA